jgi:putative phosphoesterase
MLIAIISDTHDNIPNITKVLNYCREYKIEKMIHCGDLATLETLDFINNNFAGEIFFVFGNMDNGHISDNLKNKTDYKQTHIFPDFGQAEIADRKVAFVHYPDVAKELCESGKYDFVFHGHTHKPWTEIINNCTLLNPGNVANQYYQPTFAIWNTLEDKFELIRINELK